MFFLNPTYLFCQWNSDFDNDASLNIEPTETLFFNLHKIPSALLRPRYGIKHFGIDPASCSKRNSLPSETVT